jgi:hypothetical protein
MIEPQNVFGKLFCFWAKKPSSPSLTKRTTNSIFASLQSFTRMVKRKLSYDQKKKKNKKKENRAIFASL